MRRRLSLLVFVICAVARWPVQASTSFTAISETGTLRPFVEFDNPA
jgi:hypothetical protein